MVYRPNIPASTDQLAKSSQEIQENFNEVLQTWTVDHVSLMEDDKLGKHKKMTFPEQSSAPTTAAGEVAVYSANDVNSDLYYEQMSAGGSGKLVSNKHVALGGVKLEAYAVFNAEDGEFYNAPVLEKSEDGGTVVGSRLAKSNNVSSVDIGGLVGDTITINIDADDPLSTADYFTVIEPFYKTGKANGVYPVLTIKNAATYSTSCTTTLLQLQALDMVSGSSGLVRASNFFSWIKIEIWTVA